MLLELLVVATVDDVVEVVDEVVVVEVEEVLEAVVGATVDDVVEEVDEVVGSVVVDFFFGRVVVVG